MDKLALLNQELLNKVHVRKRSFTDLRKHYLKNKDANSNFSELVKKSNWYDILMLMRDSLIDPNGP